MAKAILIGPGVLLQSISALWGTRLKSVTISEDEGVENTTSDGVEKIKELQQQLLDKQVIIDELTSTIAELQKVISNYEAEVSKQSEAKPKAKSKK